MIKSPKFVDVLQILFEEINILLIFLFQTDEAHKIPKIKTIFKYLNNFKINTKAKPKLN